MTTKIEPTEWLYRPLLRPASFCTLPEGLSWNYVEVPSEYAADRPDLPISRHRFGIIATTRQLTAKERYTFDLEQVSGHPIPRIRRPSRPPLEGQLPCSTRRRRVVNPGLPRPDASSECTESGAVKPLAKQAASWRRGATRTPGFDPGEHGERG